MTVVAQAEGLSQRFGRREVFRSLDLQVTSGVTGLLGPNGAGKTTLMSLLCGLRQPSGGTLTVLGHSPANNAGRRQIAARLGFLPQTFGYYPGYRLREFVEVAAWLKKVPGRDITGAADRALAAVALSDRADSKMRSLSGGMLRRAGIAQAIVHRPELLILGEPSAGLDPQQRIALRRLITRLAETSSVLLSTHLVDDVTVVAQRVVVLDEGRVKFSGTARELAERARPDAEGDSETERGYSAVLDRDLELA